MTELRDVRTKLAEIESHFARVERGAKAAITLLAQGQQIVLKCDLAAKDASLTMFERKQKKEHADWMHKRLDTLKRHVATFEFPEVDRDQLWSEVCEALGIEFTIEP
jgi:hypothetical protein